MNQSFDEDAYRTIEKDSEGLFRAKGSKFLSYCFSIRSEDELKSKIQKLRTKHHKARHWCWAYRINPEDPSERSNDDGEPAGTAGIPILNQLRSKELINVGVVVVRYFGGIKLGVRGLIEAYGESTANAFENSKIQKKTRTTFLSIHFGYEIIGQVQQALHELKLEPIEKKYTESCFLKLEIPLSKVEHTKARLENIYGLRISD